MSQNPYHDQNDRGYGADEFDYQDPPRTSLLAVFSIILAIPCACLPVVGIVPGILAITLAAISLGLIKNSNGRLSGRTPAITGIFLGLLMVVINGAIALGLAQGYTYYNNTMTPVVDTFMVSASNGDYAAARAELSPAADSAVTDEQIEIFIRAIETDHGAIRALDTDIGLMIESFANVYQQGSSPSTRTTTNQMTSAPIPFAMTTDQSSLIAVALFDPNSLDTKQPKLLDMMVLIPGVKAISLRPDGPAFAEGAGAYGVQLLAPAEALEESAQKAIGENGDDESEADESESPE